MTDTDRLEALKRYALTGLMHEIKHIQQYPDMVEQADFDRCLTGVTAYQSNPSWGYCRTLAAEWAEAEEVYLQQIGQK